MGGNGCALLASHGKTCVGRAPNAARPALPAPCFPAAASVAAAKRPANGRELPLVLDNARGDAVSHVRVGSQYLERPW